MNRCKLSNEEVIEEYLNGLSYSQIAAKAGVSRQYIGQVLNANGIKPKRKLRVPKRTPKRLTDDEILQHGNRRSVTLRGLHQFKYGPYNSKYNPQSCAEAVASVTAIYKKLPTIAEYNKIRQQAPDLLPSVGTINTHFKSWNLCLRFVIAHQLQEVSHAS